MSGDSRVKQFTLDELRSFDGKSGTPDIYVALNGSVFDVTEKGIRFYGPGGPYEAFAGKDASRCLATMTMTTSEGYDDLSDLSPEQRQSLERWETQFKDKYPMVGVLKKP